MRDHSQEALQKEGNAYVRQKPVCGGPSWHIAEPGAACKGQRQSWMLLRRNAKAERERLPRLKTPCSWRSNGFLKDPKRRRRAAGCSSLLEHCWATKSWISTWVTTSLQREWQSSAQRMRRSWSAAKTAFCEWTRKAARVAFATTVAHLPETGRQPQGAGTGEEQHQTQ